MQLLPRSWATAPKLGARTMTCTLMSERPRQLWMPCRPGGSTCWPGSSLSLLRHLLRRVELRCLPLMAVTLNDYFKTLCPDTSTLYMQPFFSHCHEPCWSSPSPSQHGGLASCCCAQAWCLKLSAAESACDVICEPCTGQAAHLHRLPWAMLLPLPSHHSLAVPKTCSCAKAWTLRSRSLHVVNSQQHRCSPSPQTALVHAAAAPPHHSMVKQKTCSCAEAWTLNQCAAQGSCTS